MSRLLLINGPNLNLLGSREPQIYGDTPLTRIEAAAASEAAQLGHQLDCFQSNHEGELVERIQAAAADGTALILINAGAYTHTSVALRDALSAVALPFIEVHLSNVYARETFRHRSLLSDLAAGVIVGFGPLGYRLAVIAAHQQLSA
ncbi:MAG: type II 3-dehydroquinate dehydratase [Gammaproteobacteria bacterium]|nr:type II 3-dehydroquinate dehydratase [Gammaproteobacteria bacterium]